MTCPRCGSTSTQVKPGPTPGEQRRLECANGHWLRWLPKPAPDGDGPSPALLARVPARTKPAPLRGTPRQVRFARSLRQTLLFRLARAGRDDLHSLVLSITDATWFIANQGRPLEKLRWPDRDQVEGPEPTGRCSHCGGPAYDHQPICSDECGDALAADCLGESGPEP